jgi:hypothetical protein
MEQNFSYFVPISGAAWHGSSLFPLPPFCSCFLEYIRKGITGPRVGLWPVDLNQKSELQRVSKEGWYLLKKSFAVETHRHGQEG